MARSQKALLGLVEQAVNQALIDRPAVDAEALGEPNKPPERPPEPSKDVTVQCRFCKKDLYTIDRQYLYRTLLFDRKLDPMEVKPTGKFGKNSSLQIECPVCGEVVFRQRNRGGIDFLTKEEGLVPSDDLREPGVRHGAMHYMVHDSSPARWRS